MAMKTDKEEINIGILDIYGFEIFEVRQIGLIVHFDAFSFVNNLGNWLGLFLCRGTALNNFVLIL